MPQLTSDPPASLVDPVTETLHGVAITDPYRWLEDRARARGSKNKLATREPISTAFPGANRSATAFDPSLQLKHMTRF